MAYGLTDASRSWYLRVKEVLSELKMKMCSVENALFYYGETELEGILVIHVDDVMFAGNDNFMREVINPFKRKFKISKEEQSCFKYVGIDMRQLPGDITLGQPEYVEGMKLELLSRDLTKDRNRLASQEETTIFRKAVETLGWVS